MPLPVEAVCTPGELLFEHEQRRSRSAAADYLRAIADNPDAGRDVTLSAGDQSVTLDLPETLDFDLDTERGTSSGAGELSIEVEVEWADDDEVGSDFEVS